MTASSRGRDAKDSQVTVVGSFMPCPKLHFEGICTRNAMDNLVTNNGHINNKTYVSYVGQITICCM